MDMITLAIAKSYTDSQRIAYEENSVITWDGNTDGLTYIDLFGFPMYRVSDKLIPPGDVQITLFDGLTMPGVLSELLPGFVASNEGIVISAKAGEYGDGEETVSLPESGTYLAYEDGNAMNIASISFETIHPIDQKYLPGVTEVFNLQDYGIDLLTMVLGGQTKVEQDNSVLITAVNNAVSAGMTPLVILHEMMPAHCFVNYAYVNGEMGFSGYLLNGEVVSRIDVIITNQAVFVFPTVLGA